MLQTLLKPGVSIASRLNLTRKFLLIFILYLFPVGYVAFYALTKHKTAIEATQNEIEHLQLLHEFKPLFVYMAKSRGLTNAYLNGNSKVKESINSNRQKVDTAINAIQNNPTYKSVKASVSSRFQNASPQWEILKAKAFNQEATVTFKQHSDLISEILNVMQGIKEQSKLMTDNDAATAFLIKSYVEELPLLAETTGKTRGIGAGIAAKGSFTSDSFITLSNYHGQLESIVNNVGHSYSGAVSSSSHMSNIKPLHDNLEGVANAFLTTTQKSMLEPDKIMISSDQYFSQGTQVIDSTMALFDKTFQTINISLEERKQDIFAEIWLNLLSSVALILGAIYLFACFSKNLLDSILRVKDCVNAVAKGDLTINAEIHSKDEMSKIGQDINQMVANTKSLVTKVLAATNDLVDTAETNNASAQMTNQKIGLQNVEVEQVATAMNQMSATVQEVASNAEESANSTANADKLSKQGYTIVQNSINSINSLAEELSKASESILELQQNVEGIGSVLDVIQGIADQTNLLALNAAIEAARAGESGRGFAVVADEVRTLASKTQESTEEIRQMIDRLKSSAEQSVNSMNKGTQRSQQTVEDAQEAGEALQQITDSVEHISSMGEQIASAATEQSSVAEEINRSVMSVKSISEDTINAANDAAKNSQFLKDVANNLKTLVAQFKV